MAIASASACTLQLDHALACGDGWVDPAAGEECDPGDPSTFVEACRGTTRPEGIAQCDGETCTLLNDREHCGICGDGFVDPQLGEACDGSNFAGKVCPSGNGQLQCTDACELDLSRCDPCNNGEVDEGEECDPAQGGGLVSPRQCAGTKGTPPLESPRPDVPYTHGETTSCENTCRFDRLPCSYCDNGSLDGPLLVDENGNTSLAEWCDRDAFDDAELRNEIGGFCYDLDTGVEMRPNVGCADDCRGFVARSGPACCVKKGQPCAAEGDQFPCCYAVDHPDDPEICSVVIDDQGQIQNLCK
jgi:hypothetical protein